jgi:hypothetical protein
VPGATRLLPGEPSPRRQRAAIFTQEPALDAQDWKDAIELKGPLRSNGRG